MAQVFKGPDEKKRPDEKLIKQQIDKFTREGNPTGVFNTLANVPTNEWGKYLSGNEEILKMAERKLRDAGW